MTLAIRDLQLSVVRYTSDQKIVWDSFVAASRMVRSCLCVIIWIIMQIVSPIIL